MSESPSPSPPLDSNHHQPSIPVYKETEEYRDLFKRSYKEEVWKQAELLPTTVPNHAITRYWESLDAAGKEDFVEYVLRLYPVNPYTDLAKLDSPDSRTSILSAIGFSAVWKMKAMKNKSLDRAKSATTKAKGRGSVPLHRQVVLNQQFDLQK